MSWYLEILTKILTSPAKFFEDMPKTSWKEDSLSFALICGWILAFALTTVVFLNNYLPTGLSLIEGIYGKKLLIVLPILSVMGFAFYAMTVLIVGGVMIIAVVGLLFFCAAVLHFILMLQKGTGNFLDTFKATLYTFAPLMFFFINILLMIFVKYKLLPFSVWKLLIEVVYLPAVIYMFIMFGYLGVSTHKVSKWRSYLAASVPFVILVLINLVVYAKVLPKIMGFLN